jgi:Na+-transporting NADH:ubiquinone oxidoreductase subunit C
MRGESVIKTIGVALGVSLVCSILVSATVVSLNALQKENEKRIRIRNVYIDLDLLREGESVSDVKKRTRFLLIEMKTGRELPEDRLTGILDPEEFNIKAVANDPEYGMEVPKEKDSAGIRRMPKYMALLVVYEDNVPVKYVFPVYGSGLYSTLYGFIALGKDLRTIEGISFYEHGETPGLGGEIDNTQWKNSWKGKQAFDDRGNVMIRVIKGLVDPKKPEARYQIDGLSGATFTTRGVDELVRFWLGEDGYGPFFSRVRGEG